MRYQVQQNKTITDLDGRRFVTRGIQMFDYLFCSFEARDDYRFRKILQPVGTGPAFGVSEPTYYARTAWKSPENAETLITRAKNLGINLIRVGIEPAVQFSAAYVDPVNGVEYPSDAEMLDGIVAMATGMGLVVQLQQSNDVVSLAANADFMRWLCARYHQNPRVWINPSNEPFGYVNGGTQVNSVSAWNSRIPTLLAALREDIPGEPAGTKFLNPVCIDPPGWAERMDLIAPTLSAAPFSTDPNLIVDIHIYGRTGEYDFRTARLPEVKTRWANYLPNFCMKVGEVGIDNIAGRLDPNLDIGVGSVSPTDWARMQSFCQDFLGWCLENEISQPLNGATGHMFGAYIPGLGMHDDNSMFRQDGSRTSWGDIFVGYYLRPAVSVMALMRSLTGLNQGKVSSLSYGTPYFQVEGRTGERAALAVVMQGPWDTYAFFRNRVTGVDVGAISANGAGGVNYGSLSDPRAKKDVESLNGFWERLGRLRPVAFTWKESGVADAGFLAPEFGEVYPLAVSGEPGGNEMQTIQASSPQVIADIISALLDIKKRLDE